MTFGDHQGDINILSCSRWSLRRIDGVQREAATRKGGGGSSQPPSHDYDDRQSVGRAHLRDDFRYPDFIRRVTLPHGAQYIPFRVDAPTEVTARRADNEGDEITIEFGANSSQVPLAFDARPFSEQRAHAGRGPRGRACRKRFHKGENFVPLRAARQGFKRLTGFEPHSRLLLT
jgi:hypothetical protein